MQQQYEWLIMNNVDYVIGLIIVGNRLDNPYGVRLND